MQVNSAALFSQAVVNDCPMGRGWLGKDEGVGTSATDALESSGTTVGVLRMSGTA
jgi:hypothetical protein